MEPLIGSNSTDTKAGDSYTELDEDDRLSLSDEIPKFSTIDDEFLARLDKSSWPKWVDRPLNLGNLYRSPENVEKLDWNRPV